MRATKKLKRSTNFYQALGLPKGIPSSIDFYRFRRVRSQIFGKSVIDIGCGRADFLKLIKSDYEITGTEVNMKRVEYCNKVLGEGVVILSNLEENVGIKDNSYDTVICIKVLEHLIDPHEALTKLIKISRKRVIITIPFEEEIRWFLCVHCAKYTPSYGHLHSFNLENMKGIIPPNVQIIRIELIGNRVLNYLIGFRSIFKLPIQISSIIDKIFNRIFRRARWMMIILDKKS
jgi:ubiquinone/menaquinone biosynthesis C-methylase UbiE